MANDDDLEYPRWEHHDDFHSERLVTTPAERVALFDRWERHEGSPKSGRPMPVAAPPAPRAAPPALTQAAATAVQPTFTVYDITTDGDVPLTQERLDELLLGDEVLSVLWPAIRRDEQVQDVEFPPETADAIVKVKAILDGTAVEDDADDASAAGGSGSTADVTGLGGGGTEVTAKRRGRPPKPKPEAAA